MPILVLSDIHANLTAFEAVLEDAGQVDAVWCLGDLVGYGPDHNECVALARSLPNFVCILGNHDAAVTGHIPLDSFNLEAQRSVLWMRDCILMENLQFLTDLKECQIESEVTLAHGSPRNPIWEYILDAQVARGNFGYFDTQLCFVGHTHIPLLFSLNEANLVWSILRSDDYVEINGRTIANPGSVGQPRDRDARASFALFDPENMTWQSRRVAYDVDAVKERIKEVELPGRNAQRLSGGW